MIFIPDKQEKYSLLSSACFYVNEGNRSDFTFPFNKSMASGKEIFCFLLKIT